MATQGLLSNITDKHNLVKSCISVFSFTKLDLTLKVFFPFPATNEQTTQQSQLSEAYKLGIISKRNLKMVKMTLLKRKDGKNSPWFYLLLEPVIIQQPVQGTNTAYLLIIFISNNKGTVRPLARLEDMACTLVYLC